MVYFIVYYNERSIQISPFFMAPERLTPRVLTLAQQAKANTARADAEASRPDED
jgi:hypothetical protein